MSINRRTRSWPGSQASLRTPLRMRDAHRAARDPPGVRARIAWMTRALLLTVLGAACAATPAASSETSGSDSSTLAASNPTSSSGASTQGPAADTPIADTLLLGGATVVGLGLADVRVGGAVILELGDLEPLPGETVVDLTGSFLAPGFIDSHTHLLYLPNSEGLARNGIVAAVDLAAPLVAFDTDFAPLTALLAGPMVTAVMGYPTLSWGSDGYGIECADAAAAEAAVDTLHDLGARVIKLPVTSGAQLDDLALAAAAARAHEYGLPVASHALSDEYAARAALAGADVLAHTPTSPLAPATLDVWSKRAVISTLRAFGGGGAAIANLSALHAAGARVLYGTDYGNSTVAGIDGGELALLATAGLSPAEILAAGTSAPAEFWGLDELGAIAPGKQASILVLDSDPLLDPLVLAAPVRVLVRGEWQ